MVALLGTQCRPWSTHGGHVRPKVVRYIRLLKCFRSPVNRGRLWATLGVINPPKRSLWDIGSKLECTIKPKKHNLSHFIPVIEPTAWIFEKGFMRAIKSLESISLALSDLKVFKVGCFVIIVFILAHGLISLFIYSENALWISNIANRGVERKTSLNDPRMATKEWNPWLVLETNPCFAANMRSCIL